jgi:hypothetical protein
MKKLIFCLAIALTVFSVASFAQQGGGGAERYKQMLKDSLQLTEVQIDSVMAVRQQYQPQMRDIFMDQSLSQEDKMAKIKDINTQMKARYKAFLTDDQIAKLDAMQQRMRGQGRRGGGGGGNNQ